ncbi:hypothetical protein RB195_021871 [Necator americanus]|uniref:Uncharacterized protein n=1 Tax=Necator americanus TaxID=51031 RepID=A0ABR1ED03_NECAM
MSSTIPRIAVRQVARFSNHNNPFMTTQTSAEQTVEGDHAVPSVKPTITEDVSQQQQGSNFSITKFFQMSWTDNESLDQILIRNIRRLMEEERDRQIAFERMCQTRLNY